MRKINSRALFHVKTFNGEPSYRFIVPPRYHSCHSRGSVRVAPLPTRSKYTTRELPTRKLLDADDDSLFSSRATEGVTEKREGSVSEQRAGRRAKT